MTTDYEHDWQPNAQTLNAGSTFERCSRCGAHRYAVLSDSTCRVPPPAPSIGDAMGRALGGIDAIDWRFRRKS